MNLLQKQTFQCQKQIANRTRIFEQVKKHISGLDFRQPIINKSVNRRNGFRWCHFSLGDLVKSRV